MSANLSWILSERFIQEMKDILTDPLLYLSPVNRQPSLVPVRFVVGPVMPGGFVSWKPPVAESPSKKTIAPPDYPTTRVVRKISFTDEA